MRVDVNCDSGESFGAWRLGQDEALLAHMTSASVACGFHAGDPSVMRRTVRLARHHGVAVGAHPGLPDLVGFGRRAMEITPEEAYDLVVYQVGALAAVAHTEAVPLRHVKPHGALYNMAARQPALADAIARAVRDVDARLTLFGLAGSCLTAAGRAHGLHTVDEVFPERGYAADGALLPRSHPEATIHDPTVAADRAVRMVRDGCVRSADGTEVALVAGTLCIHGDAPNAVAIAQAIRAALDANGITVAAPESAP